ncbi:ASCH domain-containing protein [Desulfobacterales bacterium HSG17]|nr:ASCH domain-containing protein [Desulfobacterales bacterium HSG17]
MPDILLLTLKHKWFDLIASGKKRREYREIKPYWATIGGHAKF